MRGQLQSEWMLSSYAHSVTKYFNFQPDEKHTTSVKNMVGMHVVVVKTKDKGLSFFLGLDFILDL